MAMNLYKYNMSKSCYLDYGRSICVNVLKLWFIPHLDFEMELLVDLIQHKKNLSKHTTWVRGIIYIYFYRRRTCWRFTLVRASTVHKWYGIIIIYRGIMCMENSRWVLHKTSNYILTAEFIFGLARITR